MIDIGCDHQIEFVAYKDDSHAGLNVYHKRPDGSPCVGFIAFEDSTWVAEFGRGRIAAWRAEKFEPLTCSPSLLCNCGDHGWIKDGKWIKA